MKTTILTVSLSGLLLILMFVLFLSGEKSPPSTQSDSASITYLAPTISNSGDQVLEPGSYDIKWESKNIDVVVVSVVNSEMSSGDSLLVIESSGPIDAQLGQYTIYVPASTEPGSKKYHFSLLGASGEQIYKAESPSFVVVTK